MTLKTLSRKCLDCGSHEWYVNKSRSEYITSGGELRVYKNVIYACAPCQRSNSTRIKKDERQKILEVMGNKCINCGYDDHRALQIDHVNGNPKGETTEQAQKKILLGETFEYQILCANCNWIKRWENKEFGGTYD